MSEPNTRNPAITREEALQLIQKMAKDMADAMGHGGAQVNVGVTDRRFTKLISWVWVSIGAAAVATGAWGVTSINELNVKVGVLISQRDQDMNNMNDLRERVKELERRKP